MDPEKSSKKLADDELTRLAVEKIMEETKMAAMRAERVGTFGWQPSQTSINKQFLHNTLISNASHNKRKEREKPRRNNSCNDS